MESKPYPSSKAHSSVPINSLDSKVLISKPQDKEQPEDSFGVKDHLVKHMQWRLKKDNRPKLKQNLVAEPNKSLENEIQNSLIGFSRYPIAGTILQEIFNESELSDIRIQEITCWKFLIQFPNSLAKSSFDPEKIKLWLFNLRSVEEEDLIIKRRVAVEVRGMPYTSWAENNLIMISKEIGSWGWWLNSGKNNLL